MCVSLPPSSGGCEQGILLALASFTQMRTETHPTLVFESSLHILEKKASAREPFPRPLEAPLTITSWELEGFTTGIPQ